MARVQAGMRLAEVEALLGGLGTPFVRVGGAGGWSESYQWDGARGKAEVWLRADLNQPEGRVQTAVFRPHEGRSPASAPGTACGGSEGSQAVPVRPGGSLGPAAVRWPVAPWTRTL